MARYDKAYDVRSQQGGRIEREIREAEREFGSWTEKQWAIIDMERSGKRGKPVPKGNRKKS